MRNICNWSNLIPIRDIILENTQVPRVLLSVSMCKLIFFCPYVDVFNLTVSKDLSCACWLHCKIVESISFVFLISKITRLYDNISVPSLYFLPFTLYQCIWNVLNDLDVSVLCNYVRKYCLSFFQSVFG